MAGEGDEGGGSGCGDGERDIMARRTLRPDPEFDPEKPYIIGVLRGERVHVSVDPDHVIEHVVLMREDWSKETVTPTEPRTFDYPLAGVVAANVKAADGRGRSMSYSFVSAWIKPMREYGVRYRHAEAR